MNILIAGEICSVVGDRKSRRSKWPQAHC